MAIAKRIHVLGTGVAIVRKYYNTAFILEDESSYFLVDGMGGIDILRRFDEMKLDWQKLHHAFLSHTHTDHSLGMVYVLRYVAFWQSGSSPHFLSLLSFWQSPECCILPYNTESPPVLLPL